MPKQQLIMTAGELRLKEDAGSGQCASDLYCTTDGSVGDTLYPLNTFLAFYLPRCGVFMLTQLRAWA